MIPINQPAWPRKSVWAWRTQHSFLVHLPVSPLQRVGGLNPSTFPVGCVALGLPPPSRELWVLSPACPCGAKVTKEEILSKVMC